MNGVVSIFQAPPIRCILDLFAIFAFPEHVIAHSHVGLVGLKYPRCTFCQIAFRSEHRKLFFPLKADYTIAPSLSKYSSRALSGLDSEQWSRIRPFLVLATNSVRFMAKKLHTQSFTLPESETLSKRELCSRPDTVEP